MKRRAFERDRPDQGAETQDEQDVDQVGPDNVAHRQTWASLSRCIDADCQLRQAGAERDDRKTDHDRPDAKAGGERGAATHQQFGSHEQPGESGDVGGVELLEFDRGAPAHVSAAVGWLQGLRRLFAACRCGRGGCP
jgi:hypothetical protein